MPELPEVETVRRGLAPHLTGRRIERITLNRPDLRWPIPADLPQRAAGRTIRAIERRAKYLLLWLEGGPGLLAHLGMSGKLMLSLTAPAPRPHDHVTFRFDDGRQLTFNDPRRFGALDLVEPAASHPLLARLGPEPLDPGFTGQVLARALAGKRTPIKAALLDQRIVAGLGNIYVCEALFRARIAPTRPALAIAPAEAERLVAAIRAVLEEAIEAGGSSLRDYVQASGEAGWFQTRFRVYDREGLPCGDCTCDALVTGGIERLVQAGRSTFWCPHVQG